LDHTPVVVTPVTVDKTLEKEDTEPPPVLPSSTGPVAPDGIHEPVDPDIIQGPRKRAPLRKILAIQRGTGTTLAQAPLLGTFLDLLSGHLAAMSSEILSDPCTVAEAQCSAAWPHWSNAMQEEV
jgi:hypothetical protein